MKPAYVGSLFALASFLVAPLAAASEAAGAAHTQAPPEGWEAPPARVTPARGSPACCGYDSLCCERQLIVDAQGPPGGLRRAGIDVRDLPMATVETALDAPVGVEGAPTVRVLDGRGRPMPWPDGPSGEVRVMPPGELGEIAWKNSWSPYFHGEADRAMGHGAVRTVLAADGPIAPAGAVDFTSFSSGAEGTVQVDRVIGVLRGSPQVDAAFWEHVAARPVVGGTMHAYLREAKGPREVVLVLPEVVRQFESRSSEIQGGFFPSRFSRTEAFTRYSLPAEPERSGTVRFELLASQVRHWFPRPPGSRAPTARAVFVVSSSQTRAERAPRIRIFERAQATSFD